ncbi:MAG: bestrophin family protein [Brachymonas sp.]|nr:bestrophin family protein [Brachymonas sp.]
MFLPPRNLSVLRILFSLEGSIIPKIWRRVAYTIVLSAVVNATHGFVYGRKITLTPTAFTIMGLTLAIFLGFRNTVSYDRFWEARRLWGIMFNAGRNLARQFITLAPPQAASVARQRVYLVIAFVYAVKNQLRGKDPAAELAPFLQPDVLEKVLAAPNRPTAILMELGHVCGDLLREGMDPQLVARVDNELADLTLVLGGCERIKATPIPYPFLLLLHRTVHVYCFLLPFALVETIGYLTPLVVGVVSYTFFGLDAVGDEIADPFDEEPNDLALNAISRTIEINMRAQLGETDLPEPVQPVGGVLL